ncbi:hypothetical protein BaRGS_00013212 [Batillaria attramentaria]|uniref:Sushi domain-containing protein n=1 Tax=Batillaria attramentaria TaxID=370345 RepID=A0ABD0L7Z9_9CAEN
MASMASYGRVTLALLTVVALTTPVAATTATPASGEASVDTTAAPASGEASVDTTATPAYGVVSVGTTATPTSGVVSVWTTVEASSDDTSSDVAAATPTLLLSSSDTSSSTMTQMTAGITSTDPLEAPSEIVSAIWTNETHLLVSYWDTASRVFDNANVSVEMDTTGSILSPSAVDDASTLVTPTAMPATTTTPPPPTTPRGPTTTKAPTTPNPAHVYRCGSTWVKWGRDSTFELTSSGVVQYRCRPGFEDDGTGVETIRCVNKRWESNKPLSCQPVEPEQPETSVPAWLVAVLIVLTVLVTVVIAYLAVLTWQVCSTSPGLPGRVLPWQQTSKPPPSVKTGQSRWWTRKHPPRPHHPPAHVSPDGVAWIVDSDTVAYPVKP